ncbi:MAG: hypothetical protein M1816_005070, partial [Peltula sp. TS41687]
SVGWHVGSRNPLNLESSFLNLLSKPMLVDVNMPETGDEFWCFFGEETDGLEIVAEDNALLVKLESDCLEEPGPSIDLLGRMR